MSVPTTYRVKVRRTASGRWSVLSPTGHELCDEPTWEEALRTARVAASRFTPLDRLFPLAKMRPWPVPKWSAATGVGTCGKRPSAWPIVSFATCVLPAGHDGWHRASEGMEWGRAL